MKKLSIATLLLLSISFGIFATEPTAGTWDYNLTVTTVYTGDYNTSSGMLYINCSNNKCYTIELGTELANLIYSSAMTAMTKSKKLDMYRSNAMFDGAYKLYRVNFHN